ncbi:MAG: hypothetical protein COZ37_00110 [bacterium (Candidatus Ratteibacteria) CG_4_10_14_3_um_filter_41_18]|uniref:Type II toxin-antitoxin system mRNA interferase toxin, RelE/StbE family n=4 Tax=Candidatus Ratteibacteria TaxID=2979319 RepID=A0A2M7E811_9BACT|nr:MAG: hypothetical protein COS11_05100 [bacterium (Candidatus Ratteibacteria) CG01_land_8_20_14_3_00_40_19]PIW33509.1 MAG: hypothetical protein COW28_03920 [bacterium (Candidatus Ratteibacteria) CG15_BIG_FIL_POST_REV_8_21_14_020_41_12]PIX77933.1 MAG: hypothetical protein COZ37_00110 [bacterium (Candidatus Ratteibacteria) CG_4_10_14_3_um_filter_41_18]PJA62023.1 MAG: hypothetical protein CO162_03290 [bacterium (Candidatus Ratteibacteria) CG_4_9_14_3_um_filter_41_21]HCG76738.1 hypothetical prote
MFQLYTTPTFERKLKTFLKRHPELKEEVKKKLNFLITNPFSSQLRVHKLSGKLRNEWALWLTYEYRILFLIESNKIFLTNIGSHDEIY